MFRRALFRLLHAFSPQRGDADLAREIASHLALLEEDFLRRGLSEADARLAARRAFGGVEQAKEHHRDARSFRWIDDARRDLKYAGQLLRRTPVFALTATFSLAIGIGATTTIFTVANALLLRAPAGVAAADRIVDIYQVDDRNAMSAPFMPFAAYTELARQVTSFDGLYAFQPDVQPTSMRVGAVAERVFAGTVTPGYFSVLRVGAAAGRLFAEGDGDTVVLSHRFWTRRFDADPAIVGRTLWVNGRAFAVAGVAAEAFRGTSVVAPEIWMSTTRAASLMPNAALDGMQVLAGGRLKDGVSLTQAAAEVDVAGRAVYAKRPMRPERPGGGIFESAPRLQAAATSRIPGTLRRIVAAFLALLMGLVALVLAIACANLAGVLLARASARRLEIAVRLAIGAGRGRLIRQLLTETLVIFLLGGAAGLLIARLLTSLIAAWLLPTFPVPVNLSLPLDARVFAFTAGLSLVAALLSGLAPALQASKADVVSALKDDAQGPADRLRLRNAFVIAQVAFSILLVVAAGLLGRAMQRVSVADQGYDPRGIEVASVDLSLAGYTGQTGPAFVRTLLERVRELPGLQAVALADRTPRPGVMTMMFGEGLSVPGVTPPNGQPYFNVSWTSVEPGYFEALRIPLVAGRDFTERDRTGEPAVAILPAATAKRLWPGESAVGKSVQWQPGGMPGSRPSPRRSLLVVGVVADLRQSGPPEQRSVLPVYAPLQQRYTPRITIMARSTDGADAQRQIRAALQALDPNLPILSARSLEQEITGPVQQQLRVAASVSGTVGVVSLLLAAIGIYGVTAYMASRRTREIGIRVALGAQRGEILAMMLRQGMALVGVGAAIGLVLAAASGRLLTRLLFGVPPLDPVTFGAATLLFAIIGLAACYLPARRATRVDPMVALRYE